MGLKSDCVVVIVVEKLFAPYMGLKSVVVLKATEQPEFAPYMGLRIRKEKTCQFLKKMSH